MWDCSSAAKAESALNFFSLSDDRGEVSGLLFNDELFSTVATDLQALFLMILKAKDFLIFITLWRQNKEMGKIISSRHKNKERNARWGIGFGFHE